MQAIWESFEPPKDGRPVCPVGFPEEPATLVTAQLSGNSELQLVVGGSSASTSWPSLERPLARYDFDELLSEGGGETPMDLWFRPARSQSSTAANPFRRSIVAFPPRPRFGCSLTALDGRGSQLLLFGGRSGRPGSSGRCFADLHVLQLPLNDQATNSQPAPRHALNASERHESAAFMHNAITPSQDSDSGSDIEEIFIAPALGATSGKAGGAAVPAAAASQPLVAAAAAAAASRGSQFAGRYAGFDSDDEADAETDGGLPSPLPSARPATSSKLPITSGSLAMMPFPSRLQFADVEQPMAQGLETGGNTGICSLDGARWRQPQAFEGSIQPRPRAGHSAVLQTPAIPGEPPAVLIYGGLGDGGQPLGDVLEVRVLQTEAQSLESVWTVVDCDAREHCETAPWEHQLAPRPRMCHSAVFSAASQRQMIVFGGIGMGLEGEPRAHGDTWLFVIGKTAGNKMQTCWKRPLMQGGAPSRRWGHGACLVGGPCGGGSSMLVCGGRDGAGASLADCWLLDLEEMRWEAVEECCVSLLPRPKSFLLPPGSEQSQELAQVLAVSSSNKPDNLGRCTAVWSSEDSAVIVWSSQGMWKWHEPERCRLQRLEKERQKGGDLHAPGRRNDLKDSIRVGSKGDVDLATKVGGNLVNELRVVDEWKRPGGSELGHAVFGRGGALNTRRQKEQDPESGLLQPARISIRELPSMLPPVRRQPLPLSGITAASQASPPTSTMRSSLIPSTPKVAGDHFGQSWPPVRPCSRGALQRQGPPSAGEQRPSASRLDLGPLKLPWPSALPRHDLHDQFHLW